MELIFSNRNHEKKLEAKRLRREGQLPAILYSRGNAGEAIAVDAGLFKKMLMRMPQGALPTTVFTLKQEGSGKKGRELRAILKDIQYKVTTYEPIHLDFVELIQDVPVTVNVPVQCVGVADCVGIKLGGSLRQVMRFIRVRCLPKDIPTSFEVDVRDLNVGQMKRLEDMGIPENIRPLADPRQSVVVIAKR